MARARLVCGECNAELLPHAEYCSQCGAKIVFEETSAPNSTEEWPARICGICGYSNEHAEPFCTSCGGELPEAPLRRVQKKAAPPHIQTKTDRQKPKTRKKRPRREYEPWQIIAVGVIVALIGVFVYLETNRIAPPGQQMTGQSTPASNISPQDLQNLQQTVDANPNDAAAVLRLANALHDAGQTNSSYYLRSIDTYKKYLELKPDDPNARVDLGICYFELARMDTMHAASLFTLAIDEMQTVARTHPDHQPAAFNLGIVNLFAGNTTESTQWFKRAVEINANSDLGMRAKKLLEEHTFQSTPG